MPNIQPRVLITAGTNEQDGIGNVANGYGCLRLIDCIHLYHRPRVYNNICKKDTRMYNDHSKYVNDRGPESDSVMNCQSLFLQHKVRVVCLIGHRLYSYWY